MHNPPATSWSEWRTKVFVWSARVLSYSLLPLVLFCFGHHGWSEGHVVVTAETVKHRRNTASRCFSQKTHTQTRRQQRQQKRRWNQISNTWYQKQSLSWSPISHDTTMRGDMHTEEILLTTTYGFGFHLNILSHTIPRSKRHDLIVQKNVNSNLWKYRKQLCVCVCVCVHQSGEAPC